MQFTLDKRSNQKFNSTLKETLLYSLHHQQNHHILEVMNLMYNKYKYA